MSTKKLKSAHRMYRRVTGLHNPGLRTFAGAIALTEEHSLCESARAWYKNKGMEGDYVASNAARHLSRTLATR